DRLPLVDDFSDRSSGWPTLGDRHGSVAYHGGGYVFAAADAALRFVPVPAGRAEHAVAARVSVTSAGGGWAGIGCRMGGALLAGEVSPAGRYRIIRHDGSLTRLVAGGRLPEAAA